MASRLTHCRVCNGDLLSLWELGNFALCGYFPEKGEYVPSEPMGLSQCFECGLVQMHYRYDQDLYGVNYGYRSGLNGSMVEHLRGIAEEAKQYLTPSDCALDIGGNDGTLLSFLDGERVLIDPTATKWSVPEDIKTVAEPFGMRAFWSVSQAKPKVIFSIAMFYDLEDPVDFAKDVSRILHDNGVWILEQSYLPWMLRKNAFDTICHEHLEYYTLATLREIMERADLEIIEASTNNCNGGSIRIKVAHKGAYVTAVDEHLEMFDAAFDVEREFRAMRARLDDIEDRLKALMKDRKMVGFGASTKGNTLLQYFKLDLQFIVDINPDKHWRTTPGTRIPIVPENWAVAHKPFTYLVLPWHFKDFIVKTNPGQSFIFPLPEVTVVDP